MKTLFKTVLREVKYNFGRFAAIFAITALGVGFLAGLLSTAPDFYRTIDTYYDSSNFMDFNIKSTAGLTQGDLESINNEEYVENAVPAKVSDVVVKNGESDECVARIYGIDLSDLKKDEYVNKLNLVKGRYPESSDECIAFFVNSANGEPKLNTKFRLCDEKDAFNNNEMTVVGIAEAPTYMSIEKESSNIGNGRVSLILYTSEEIYNFDYYTDIYVTLNGAKDMNSFYGEYRDFCDEYKEKLNDIAVVREEKRFEELKEAAVSAILSTDEGKQLTALGLAENIIDTAEQSVEKPVWYFLDRETNVSYVSLKSNAEKVNAIAKVFPVFFFLVAALVALTTMTRMVDEQRTEIGTLKALGYSSASVSAKYLLYSGIAAVSGGIIGLVCGLYLLPMVIINVYHIMYRLPDIVIGINLPISLISLITAVLCITAATGVALLTNLKEAPARLMLPRAPKSGKRIFLEYIHFIWNKMKFTHKVTARNLFRYKKRFFMTVIGISGCTALLLTGFGLRDAIGDIVPKQYNEIQKYDLTVQLDPSGDSNEITEYLTENKCNYFEAHTENGNIYVNDTAYEINIYVPHKCGGFENYVNLRERQNGNTLDFNSSSVIVTEKFAKTHNLKKGSKIKIKNSEGKTSQAEINGICENYIYSYIYISPEKYSEMFDETCEFSTLLVKTEFNDEKQDAVMTEILNFPCVSSAFFSSSVVSSFKNMINSINYIVAVLILAAGLLAFVVLYNLININISERQKEIATIKVLGFFDNEVNSYICREIYILSIIGTLLGMLFGFFLCGFVVRTAEVDMVMFGRRIYLHSYFLAAIITFLFTVAVNSVMSFKLKKIDMVESLKSCD